MITDTGIPHYALVSHCGTFLASAFYVFIIFIMYDVKEEETICITIIIVSFFSPDKVSRLKNHRGDIGMTDSLAVTPDGYLMAASFLVDSGCPSINGGCSEATVFNMKF